MNLTAADSSSDSIPDSEAKRLHVVGVGASAGGLEALQRTFEKVPLTGQLAFVVIQHLSPDFKSLMDELLSPHTRLQVHRAENGMLIEPDHVYLMPPKSEMIVSAGRLYLTERDPSKGLSLPIDAFFRSLAEDLGTRGVAVVLSGTGSDGSRGIRAVHEAGGLVIAQTEDSAKFDGMPRSAVDTGIVDLVLSPEQIGETLARYLEHDGRLGDLGAPAAGEDVTQRIFALLKQESGIDFGDYKPSTVGRRIERRLLLTESRDLDTYVARLGSDPEEVRALYCDLLIGVTRFFRDPEAFQRLANEILPELCQRTPNEEVRVWVPSTASGEEAYTMGMLLCETFRGLNRPPHFRIFATDVHRPSLEQASSGLFPADSLLHVPPELRDRYFERRGDAFQVTADLRGHIVFAHHNALRDAPFTRLDLVSCRNFLIYLQPPAQRRVLALFHFGLKTGGTLLLGPSETPGPLAEEFATVDSRWKIFRKSRDVRIPDVSIASPGAPLNPAVPRAIVGRPPAEDPRVIRGREALLERYAPPTLLVDEAGHLLHNFNGAGEFLTQRDGKPSLNVLDLLEGELRFVVAGALKRAQKDRGPVSYGGVQVAAGGDARRVRVVVQAMGAAHGADECFAIALETERTPSPEPEPRAQPTDVDALVKDRLAVVEGELRLTKENLQATIEEMETSNEELQATNEELIASNEELQSTNEELHSVNEELYTVNAEYQAKIAELTELSTDMNHLLEATEVHTIFLDRELRVRKFTPKIARTFNLLPQDIGRRIDAFAHTLNDDDLMKDLESVARAGQPVEREVRDRQGHWYLLRVLPYKTALVQIDGVVLILVDIAAVKQAQKDLEQSEERYRTLVRAITAILWTADSDGRFATPQAEWEAYTGHGWDLHRGEGWLDSIHPDDRARVRDQWRAAVAERKAFEGQGRLFSKAHDGYRHFVARAAPLLDERGRVREWVGHVVDVHDTHLAAQRISRYEAQIRAILDHSPAFIWVKDPSGRYLVASRQCKAVMGVPCDALVGKTDYDFLPVSVADELRAAERRCLESGETTETEEVVPVDAAAPGTTRTFLTTKFPLRDEHDQIYAIAGIATDITERKRDAEEIRKGVERRDQFLAMLSHELRTPLGAILNAADLLERGHDARPPSYARDVIRRQTRHMAKLIEDLLDVGRVTRDQLVLESKVIDLRQVVEDVVETVRTEADRRGLQLDLDLPSEGLPVKGDSARLRQIFTNLITNAVGYTPNGRVEVAMRNGGSQVRVSVRDTGIGLTREELDRVFELFYQTPQALDRKRGGLGVGLTLALKLARLHGGDISAESAGRGTGSCFTVTLPRAASLAEDAPAENRRPDGRLSIVLVEDNEDIRDTLQDLLRLEGHDVVAECEGIRGAATIVEKCPDVAIVDLGLPGMDGFAVAKKVRTERGSAVRLIALTGYGGREDRMETAGAGFDRHLVKPIDHDMLMRVLAEIEAERRPAA